MSQWDDLLKYAKEMCSIGGSVKYVMCGNDKGCENCKYRECPKDEGLCESCHSWDFKWEPKKYDEHIEALEGQIENYEDTIVDLSREVHELENLCDGQNKLIDILEDQIKNQDEYIKELEDEIDGHKGFIKICEATLNQYRKMLANTNAITDTAVALLKAAGYEVTYVGD